VRPKLSLFRSKIDSARGVTAPISYAGHTICPAAVAFGQWITVAAYKLGLQSGKILSMPKRKGRSSTASISA